MEKKYRDTFFRFYFSDKRRLLSLCNALTGEDATDPNELEINTLEENFFSKRKNDISCLFRGRQLILIEQQSTLNGNMPLRFLLYFGKLLNKIFDKEFSQQLHGSATIKMPRPEFFVLYNGQRKAPAFQELKLSDAFLERSESLELKVKFFNLNAPHNRELIQKSLPLEDYCVLVERYAANFKSGMKAEEAFYEAYKFCMRTREWMLDFLEEHEWELFDMISTEYNEEWALAAQRAEGFEEGRAEGFEEGKIEMIKNLLKTSTPIEYIIEATGWTKEKILSLAKN